MSHATFLSSEFATRLGMKRWVLATLSVSLAVNGLLALTLLIKDEKVTTILVPMGLSEAGAAMKISDATISEAYLTLVARDLLTLAMNQTPENTDFNRKKLLDYALPSAFSELDEVLKIRSDRLKRLRASTFFAIDTMHVDEKALIFTADGYLLHYIGFDYICGAGFCIHGVMFVRILPSRSVSVIIKTLICFFFGTIRCSAPF